MPSSSSSQSSNGLSPFFLFDGYGAIYKYDPAEETTYLFCRIWGPGDGVISGLASWIDGSTLVFCALKKNIDGSAWLLYRDGTGGHISDLYIKNDPGWKNICPWPGDYKTMVTSTETGISLIEVGQAGVSSTEIITTRRIYSMATGAGNSSIAQFCCFSDYNSSGNKVIKSWIRKNPLSYLYEQKILDNLPPRTTSVVQISNEIFTVNDDGNGGINVVSYQDSVPIPSERIPISVRGSSFPVAGGSSLPKKPSENIFVSTLIYNEDGSIKDYDSPFFFTTTTPGETSDPVIIKLRVSGVKKISNVRLGLVSYDSNQSSVLITTSPSFNGVGVPSIDLMSNIAADPDSPFNVIIPVSVNNKSGVAESEYVGVSMKMNSQSVGVFQCKFKWFFDYDPEPFNMFDNNSSSSSSSNSSSESSSPSSS